MDNSSPRAEAVALAGNRILAVGSAAEVQALAGPNTRQIDARGATVMPGFNEAHMHIFPGSVSLRQLNLHGIQASTPSRQQSSTMQRRTRTSRC